MVLLRSPAQWDDVGKARGHRGPGGFWCRQERDDGDNGDGLLAVVAVAGRGGNPAPGTAPGTTLTWEAAL